MPSILIVEDDPIIAHDISIILQKHSYDISGVCHKGTKAIDRLSKGRIDAVILDIHLGTGQSGIDVARVIHKTYDLPYIFLTSFSDSETLQAAQEQGPYGYLVKPFQEATLITTLAIAISNHQLQSKSIDFSNLSTALTEQEEKICRALYEGKPYQCIADDQHVSINTIRYHVKNLYTKFDVNSRAALIAHLIS